MKLAKMHLPIITCNAKNGLPPDTVSFQELIENKNVNYDVLKEVKKRFEDVILLPYSSGTTGLPKGVELTNKNLVANCVQQDVKEYRHYEVTTGKVIPSLCNGTLLQQISTNKCRWNSTYLLTYY